MKRIITILASMLCLCMVSQAKLALSSVCSDGMVLQQNTEAVIWGTSDAGAKVTVTPSWNGKGYCCKADADGKWSVKVETPAGSYKAYSIAIKGGGDSVKINDVLVGEVWLASGQSDMEMPM
jgi:sialate O-acetylesterase